MARKINDFGEKIGGARKDLWKGRGLNLNDLGEMNDAEKKKYVTKDNVWPKPNWEQLIAEGKEKIVCFWQNEVRKSLPKDCSDMAGSDRHERYVSFVGAAKEHVMAIERLSDAKSILAWLKAEQYIVMTSAYRCNIADSVQGVLTNAFLKAIQNTWEYSLKKKKTFLLFGVPKDKTEYATMKSRLFVSCYNGVDAEFRTDVYSSEKRKCLIIHIGKSSIYFYPKKAEEYESTWKKGTWFVADYQSRDVVAYNLESEEDAREKVEELSLNAQTKRNGNETAATSRTAKKVFRYAPLSSVVRTGMDWRNGSDVTPEKFMETFGFRGGEFGNWLGDKERQENLNFAYDALLDLSDILHLDPKALAFHGSLSVAFGARGKGGAAAAMAHYEPLRRTINLTRMKGAGCLAHEWAHALDHYLADFIPTNGNSVFATEFRFKTDGLVEPDILTVWKKLLSAFWKKEDGGITDFYLGSSKFDQLYRKSGHDYWSSTCEMFARAFDCYIEDKLKEKGIRSDYLTAHASSFTEEIDGKVYHAYPVGKERIYINHLFDELFAYLSFRQLGVVCDS